MKPVPTRALVLRTLLAVCLPLGIHAEEPVASAPATARTLIPHALEVVPFTPPAPVVPKRLPAIRIDSTVTVPSAGGSTLTLKRGEASTLPDLPPSPPPEPARPARAPSAADIAHQIDHWRHSIHLGATVHDHRVSVVHWTDQETKETYQAVCGFDIGLIAGIRSYLHDGEEYSVDLMHSDVGSEEADLRQLDVPEVAAGQILITRGDSAAPYPLAQLGFIRELIASENARLTAFQAARRQQQQRDAAAWDAAHPPVPRDEVFIFRPHRGSRYLADPQPEKTEDAR